MTAPCACVPPTNSPRFRCKHGAQFIAGKFYRIDDAYRVPVVHFSGPFGALVMREAPESEQAVKPHDLGAEYAAAVKRTPHAEAE